MKLSILFLICIGVVSLEAQKYALIANKSIGNLSKREVKAIYLKKMRFKEGVEIIALHLETKEPIRASFEDQFLQMSFYRLREYWIEQHYLGVRPPITLHSQESVKAFVKKVKGAVGYIELQYADDEVSVLYEWESAE